MESKLLKSEMILTIIGLLLLIGCAGCLQLPFSEVFSYELDANTNEIYERHNESNDHPLMKILSSMLFTSENGGSPCTGWSAFDDIWRAMDSSYSAIWKEGVIITIYSIMTFYCTTFAISTIYGFLLQY
uniref:Uncharacterized protein n=1 Tax=Anopheles albimanus TaxID=7167 RepID=A0A182FX46_ANOAL